MKIALVSPYDFSCPGGVVTHINALSKEFLVRGYEVRIVAPVSEGSAVSPPHLIKATGSVLPVPYGGAVARISLSPRIYRRVKYILRQEQFDVIHLHEPLSPGLSWGVLRHVGVSPESLVVGTFHAYQESSKGYAFGKPLFRRFINRLHGRIAVSEAARDYVAQHFLGKYVIIPNGIDLERFGAQVQPLEPYVDGRLNVLFVGRLERRKGFEFLLRAFAGVQAALPETRLMVVGAFSQEDAAPYRALSQALELNHVQFVGPVSDDELPRYYRSSHLFCAPSIGSESFGLVLLEAMAVGVPILASDIRGYRAVLAGGRAGVLVPPKDVGVLAGTIVRLLQDPAQREARGQWGRSQARAYSWTQIAERILCYYRWLRAQRQSTLTEHVDEWEVEHAPG